MGKRAHSNFSEIKRIISKMSNIFIFLAVSFILISTNFANADTGPPSNNSDTQTITQTNNQTNTTNSANTTNIANTTTCTNTSNGNNTNNTNVANCTDHSNSLNSNGTQICSNT